MEPEQEVLRACLQVIPLVAQRRPVLADRVAPAARPVEADALLVGPVIVHGRPVEPPRVGILGHRGVVIAANQMVQAERHGVVDVRLARSEHERADRPDDVRRVAPRHPDPLVGDLGGPQAWIPGQPAVRVPVGLSEVVARPVRVLPGVGHARHPRALVAVHRSVQHLRHRGARAGGVRVRVEELLPHRREVDEVVRLSEVLLRDLQLGHERRARHRAEERAERLPRLEIERPVLDLHEDVVPEAAVERHELQVRRLTRSGSTSAEYTNARHMTMPPCGRTASASMLAPSACVRA